ncbi:DUF922 domain-containing protein [Undibacterium sp. TC9W]|uniref:DUF922 domain-containing protein n=1 Tax=Undibacterium sp. TC9W TaxID=3413053 RepID=UPI003BF26112
MQQATSGQDAARRIEQSLLQYPAQATCEQLRVALNQRYNALLAEYVLLDRAYDYKPSTAKPREQI